MYKKCEEILNNLESKGKIRKLNFEFPPKQELKLKLKDMLENKVDEKYYLSDEIVSKIKYKFNNENDILGGMQEHQSIKKDGICTTLTSSMGTGGGYVPMVSRKYGVFDTEKSTHQAGSVYDDNGLSPTLDTMQGGWRQPCIEIKNNTKKGYLESYEGDGVYTNTSTKRGTVQHGMIQTLTTFQDKGVVVKDDTFVSKKYKKFVDENGYIPDMFNPYNETEIKDIAPTQSTYCNSCTSSASVLIKNKRLNSLVEKTNFEEGKVLNLDLYNQTTNENISQCLTEPHHNSQRLYDGLRIRKLTPKECWRLMGFSDEEFEKAKQVNSDTQLYKQAGNSIVVNVLMEIFKNLFHEEYMENFLKGL